MCGVTNGVVKTLKTLLEEGGSRRLAQRIVAIDTGRQHLRTIDPCVLADFEHGYNVGVMESRGRARFKLESLQMVRVRQTVKRQHLQRHMPAEGLFLRFTHSPATDFAEDLIIVQWFQPVQ